MPALATDHLQSHSAPSCMQDESADAAMSIAVLHHLSSVSRRMALLLEMVRLLKPGGRGLVTVWASEQENTKKMSSWEPLNSPDAHNSTGDICVGQGSSSD